MRSLAPTYGWWQAARFERDITLRRNRLRLRPRGYARDLVVRRGDSDFVVLQSVFADRELDGFLPDQLNVVIDAGANAGYTVAFYAHHYPGARILAVEPGPANLAILRENVASFPNVEVVAAAVWSRSGHVRIVNPAELSWGFRVEQASASDPDALRAVTINELLDQVGAERCDLLKVDIEGAETELFRDPPAWLDRVDAILIETHGDEARRTVEAACPETTWTRGICGEKLLLRR